MLPEIDAQKPLPPALEKHYTVNKIAKIWGLSASTVRRLFEKEPGVLTWGSPERPGRRRGYVSLRVPESVMIRLHQRLRPQ